MGAHPGRHRKRFRCADPLAGRRALAMYERLAAPQASRGCLDPATLRAVDLACRQVDLPLDIINSPRESTSELRELVRKSLQAADERLAARLWAGEDVAQLVRARAWVV